VRVRETAQPVQRAADNKGMLDHERLDVYQCALQFAALAFQILENMPRGHGELCDQLRRATISIPLNIAEGAGKTTERERARYHAIARGSAMECAAIVDLLRLQALVEPETAVTAKALSVRMVSMLSKMCR
jgi:four helix bundle protein